jgi:hypothetical protein
LNAGKSRCQSGFPWASKAVAPRKQNTKSEVAIRHILIGEFYP